MRAARVELRLVEVLPDELQLRPAITLQLGAIAVLPVDLAHLVGHALAIVYAHRLDLGEVLLRGAQPREAHTRHEEAEVRAEGKVVGEQLLVLAVLLLLIDQEAAIDQRPELPRRLLQPRARESITRMIGVKLVAMPGSRRIASSRQSSAVHDIL